MSDQAPVITTDPTQVVPKGALFTVRAVGPDDRPWVKTLLKQYWASTSVVSRGRVRDGATLPAFCALRDSDPIGLVTYEITECRTPNGEHGKQCEIVTHNSLAGSGGVGSCLLAAVRNEARAQGCYRLWLVTTNDNTPALRFYQRREFDIVALHRDAVVESRRLKPEIPDMGLGNIPLRHELELEYVL